MLKIARGQVLWMMLLGFLLATGLAFGQAPIPDPVGHVNDRAQIMAATDIAAVEQLASRLAADTGVEIALLTVHSTLPLSPKDYAVQTLNQWGVGGPEDSGLLILLAMEEKRIEVEVGYGLEGSLPDGLVGAVLDEYVMPYLNEGQYSAGLRQAAEAFARSVRDEDFARNTAASAQESGGWTSWMTSFIVFVLIAIVLSRGSRRPPGGRYGGHIPRSRRMMGPMGLPRGSSGSRGSFGGFGGGRSGGGGAGRGFK